MFSFEFTGRILCGALLAISAIACGPTYYSRGHHIAHGGGGGSDGLALVAVGVVAGAAIVEAAHSGDAREEDDRVYVNNNNVYYVYGPPPAPLPRSSRDAVPSSNELPPFNPQAARAALNTVDVTGCAAGAGGTGAPSTWGHAKVTFNPDGRSSKVVVDSPNNLSASTVQCIGDRIGTVTIAPFSGSMVTMGTTYHM